MSITTFADLITSPKSQKIFLVEIEPSEEKTDWTLYSAGIYYTSIEVITITSVVQNTTTLTEVTAIASLTAGTWYHGKNKLYVYPTTGTVYDKTIVANYKMYFATKNVTLNDIFYEGIVKSIPVIKQKKNDAFWGVSIISSGKLSLINGSGFFDTIYKNYVWNNKNIKILLGGESLPYSEYTSQFAGAITNKSLSTSKFNISYADKKNRFEDSIPVNSFSTSVYPNLDAEDVGKPIPLIYGTVFKVPVICTTLALGTATSLHSFKILDTSVCSVNSITQVYDNDVPVSHQSGSVSTATFKLATATYSPGDSVTVSVVANESNPIEQIKNIASNVLSIPYNSDNYSTSTISTAVTETADYPCGIAITERMTFLELISQLMQSTMGTLYVANSGKYAVKIWNADMGSDLTSVDYNDILSGSFSATSKVGDIRKIIRIGWRKNWSNNSYSYVQQTSGTTEKVYGIVKSKTVTTLQSGSLGVGILLNRLGLIYESETTTIKLSTKMQLADKNIGDRIQISFKRQNTDSNISWLNSLVVEINSITKDFINNKIIIEVDDLKGVGSSVGTWTTDDPQFPDSIGGGSYATWDSAWSTEKKIYAKANAGYWCDADGFADPSDSGSLNISRWW